MISRKKEEINVKVKGRILMKKQLTRKIHPSYKYLIVLWLEYFITKEDY